MTDDVWRLPPSAPLRGRLAVPGDKSISHRALILGTLADGPIAIDGLLDSEDVRATAAAVAALGARLTPLGPGRLRLEPPGALAEPDDVIDCGNSGTSIRLLAGLVAAAGHHVVLTGDGSLRRRPMGRIVTPLRRMGVRVDGREGGRLAPLALRGGTLAPVDHDLPIASAQVKSCLLLAGREVGVRVREPRASRDHTERMLRGMGAAVTREDGGWIALAPFSHLAATDVTVPGDVSAAAFWLVAASIVPGSDVLLEGVGDNPTRTGVVDALRAMGADLDVGPLSAAGPEPRADLRVRHTGLTGTRIDGDLALRALDELPVLAIAAACAEGETVIADAAELRVKESDRIARVVAGLRACGVDADERPDGMVVAGGGIPGGGTVDASGDHRIAMAFAVASLVAARPIAITGASSVRSSYPAFLDHLARLGGPTP